MVIFRSFILTFEDGSIRAIREPRKYQRIEHIFSAKGHQFYEKAEGDHQEGVEFIDVKVWNSYISDNLIFPRFPDGADGP